MTLTISQLRGYQIGPMEKGNIGIEQYLAIRKRLEDMMEKIAWVEYMYPGDEYGIHCFWRFHNMDEDWYTFKDCSDPTLSVADFLNATITPG